MNMIWLQISSFAFLIILLFVYLLKERINSPENKIFKSIMIVNVIGIVIEICCFISVSNIDKIPTINCIVTKLLLIYYLTYILLYFVYYIL